MTTIPATGTQPGGHPIVITVGTDALLAIADAAAGLSRVPRPGSRPDPDWGWAAPLLRQAAGPAGITAAQAEQAFPGVTLDPAASEFDDLVSMAMLRSPLVAKWKSPPFAGFQLVLSRVPPLVRACFIR